MTGRKPILVTGSHRSGTTWIGRMIAEAPLVFYIHEPFSVSDPPGRGICNTEFKYWFTHITRDNESKFYKHIKNTIELKYDLFGALKSVRSLKDIENIKREYKQFSRHRLQGSVPLIKDPVAFFSSEWLAERFDMNVIVVIRHPAAFISSLKKLNWSHPFSHFLDQPSLMKEYLHPFETDIRDYAQREHGIVDQGIIFWKLIHHTAIKYQKTHMDWIFVRHEDLSQDPLQGFQNLFNRLNLEFSEHVRGVIREYSNSNNPSETSAPVGSEISLKRNSKSNIWNWKSRLTSAEIDKIRSKVEDISRFFYSESDW